jgi:hypothetical protein
MAYLSLHLLVESKSPSFLMKLNGSPKYKNKAILWNVNYLKLILQVIAQVVVIVIVIVEGR